MKWTNEQLKDLKEKYSYYINNKKEAETYFERTWQTIKTKYLKTSIYDSIQYKTISEIMENRTGIPKIRTIWTDVQIEELKKKYFYYLNHKEEAEEHFEKDWCNIGIKARFLKITSMKINKKCFQFLGCHIAERVLSYIFEDVYRMPFNNKGFDFRCKKGFKIEVKSTCVRTNNSHSEQYFFQGLNNKIADYFLLISFDDRENLNPQHMVDKK